MLKYLNDALMTFVNDPATSEFQEGYKVALIDVRDELLRQDDGKEAFIEGYLAAVEAYTKCDSSEFVEAAEKAWEGFKS